MFRTERWWIPKGISTRLGYWKAEEVQKFTFPASEYLLSGILPDDYYSVWKLIAWITEILFSYGLQQVVMLYN